MATTTITVQFNHPDDFGHLQIDELKKEYMRAGANAVGLHLLFSGFTVTHVDYHDEAK
jgi:hypothetical protein